MKKINLKKTLLAVTLAASMAVPTASFAGAAMTANAASNVPFCADTDGNGAYNIRENLIYVSRSWYEASARSFPVTTTNLARGRYPQHDKKYIITNGDIEDLQIFGKYVVNIVVYGNDLVESDLENLSFNVDCPKNGKSSTTTCHPTVTQDAADPHKFHVSFEFIAESDTCSFTSNAIMKSNVFTSTTGSVTATLDNEDYYKIEARPADGEKLFIKMKYDPSISWGKMENWARRLCVYANSLSKTTGVTLDTLYMNFDVKKPENSNAYAISDNDTMSLGEGKYGYVCFYEDASDAERDDIATGRNVITWTALHEMAHSYACRTNSEFEKNYIFCQPKEGDKPGFWFDEYLTNARGLTAIQNCDNLRNTDINYNEHYEKYDEIAHTVARDCPNDKMMEFASNLTYMPWDVLEAYFAAESDNDTDFVESTAVARKMNEYLEMDIPLTENYLKFVNNLRKLMVLKKGAYDETKFTGFLRSSHFTLNYWRGLVTDLKLDQVSND